VSAKAVRRTLLALGSIALFVVVHHELPDLVEWKLRRELAARGFDEARFRVVAVELDRLELADVELAPGLVLGTVDNAGISLLWRDPEIVTIRGARIDHAVLARLRLAESEPPPVRILRIEDSALVVGETSIAIAGMVDLAAGEPSAQLQATARSWTVGTATFHDIVARLDGARACASAVFETAKVEVCAVLPSWKPTALEFAWRARHAAWKADGDARLEWSQRVLFRGRGDVTVPTWSHDGVVGDGITISADFEGTPGAIDATGTTYATRVYANELELANVEAPFAIRARGNAEGWRVESTELAGNARELVGRQRGEAIRASELRFRIGSLVVVSGGAITSDGRVEWKAKQVRVGRATMFGASGTIAPGSTSWRAGMVVVGGATLRAVAGTVTETIQWRAGDLRIGDASLVGLTGTVSRDGTVEWIADSGRWREARVDRPSGRISGGVVEVSAPRGTWNQLAITSLHATRDRRGEVHVDWRDARYGRLAFGRGELVLVTEADRWLLARGSVVAYGGKIAIARPVAVSAPIELDVRGIQLGSVLGVVSTKTKGSGVLDGAITVRGGELERFALRARGVGAFQVGDPAWVESAVTSIAAGHVAVSQRVGGALADFEYAKLGVVLTPTTSGPALRIELHGTGRRVRQELDLVINVRGLREAARLLVRAQEAS
jgi:hypothetical protein